MATPETESVRLWHVLVRARTPQLDGHGRDVLAEIRQIGLDCVETVRSGRLYFFSGRLSKQNMQQIAKELLTDPVAESYELHEGFSDRTATVAAVEIHTQPGVMNPVALSTLAAAQGLLLASKQTDAQVDAVQTGRRYEISGVKDLADLERIARKVLANECMETVYLDGFGRRDEIPNQIPSPPEHKFTGPRNVELRALDDAELSKLSRRAHLFLSLDEMRTIRDYFTKLERDPTDLELETLAQTWSEHCVHKTLKSAIDYSGDDFGVDGQIQMHFSNLLKETIVEATTRLDRDWCLSVFVDNAGIIALDDEYGLAFKVETHNHPSAIEPYGGAATGIGGCIRDVMGCGLGAKPIASTDVFCVGPPDFEASRLPKDVLHPRRVLKGVVSGVRDYGNRMGIPTVNGAIFFDERYVGNPLVYCGCVGLIPRNRVEKQAHDGDYIVVTGGRTGRDGIHGATFSSAELTDTHADEFSHAVQIGHAIEEKKVLDALLIARDHQDGCLYSFVTDCGAGGLSSAVGEMGEEHGAVVDLEKVPLKYSGLRYDEMWISEAQERMVFAVPPDRLDTFLAVFAAEEVEATVIGNFTADRVLRVRFQGQTVGELDMGFLHDGYPRQTLKASWRSSEESAKESSSNPSSRVLTNDAILAALGELNTASKEWVIRQYDHEVQGRSVVKPLVGPNIGPSDAAVVRPRYEYQRGVAIGCGLCPELCDVDPYKMAIAAVDEALRNVICVGANPNHTAILDNFCWPKVETEESLGALVRACKGAFDAAIAFGLPFISGKDSLNNEFSMSPEEAKRTGLPQQIAIPYTLLISAIGVVDDVRRCATMDLKQSGNCLVVASAPVELLGLDAAFALHKQVSKLITDGKVRAAHDVSDGGLAVAIAEMCIASNLGASVEISKDAYGHGLLDTIHTTYVLEMSEQDAREAGFPVIGKVTDNPLLCISGDGMDAIELSVADAANAWRSPLAKGGAR